MLKIKYFIVSLFALGVVSAQTSSVEAIVDSTTVLLGSQLNYTLQVKTDSIAEVVFPETFSFAPFEILDISPIDTIIEQSHYLYMRKFALIQFDSGNYYLPQQQVLVNGFSKLTDPIAIRVNPVIVDTLKQNLYAIKPLQEVSKNYDKLITQLLLGLLIGLVLVGILYGYLFQKRRKEERLKALPPFDKAIEQLEELATASPALQEEFKDYYSRLTDVIRRYLEEDAKIDALESTSDQLLLKLEALRELGTLNLEKETLKSLRTVLQNADLVKFAKSLPEVRHADADRKAIKAIVIETKEVLPEPTEEELRQQAEYQEMLAKKARKRQFIRLSLGVVLLLLMGLLSSMAIYGYYPVRDTLLGYPTKKLENTQWIKSQYGTPPIELETPKVLIRIPSESKTFTQFREGSYDSSFYIDLSFDFPKEAPQQTTDSLANPVQANAEKAQALVNSIISNFEAAGAVNILIKQEAVTAPSGVPLSKIYGTLDYPKKGSKTRVRCNFSAHLITFEEGTIILTMMYEKEDRYGTKIEQRIINSLSLIESL
ncbi:MAG: hypothetical protein ISP72_04860 [Flavobacteriaceae bacterium]|nr:hypothetical protein [Flavobacteriaceae bacterium]